MYTVKEIIEAIDEDFDGSLNEFMELIDFEEGSHLESINEYAKEVDFGGESRPWSVFQVGEQYFKLHGTHDSWEGTEWDGRLVEVKQVEKTVIAYEER